MKLWFRLIFVCGAWLGLLLGLTQGVSLNYRLPVVGSGSWFDRGREPVSNAPTVSLRISSIQFDRARAAPLGFLVLDFALTTDNIGPPGQETCGATGTDGAFAELPLKAGNSKQRHRHFLRKIWPNRPNLKNRGSSTAFS